ncbi:transcriptional repressor [Candidatus Saccharibacteria bacterium]|nr:transcriptional repressor [Candidatus Saccharibacteria bacterium]
MEQFETYLREHGVRLTEPRREIFKILNEYDQPLTIKEILRYSQISERTSVYRALSLFVELEITEVLQIKGKQRYELAEPFKSHHHHLVCIRCGALVPINQPKLERLVQHIASDQHYQLTSHHVELQGICSTCQKYSEKIS